MKNIKKVILTVCCITVLTSCNKFLDVKPTSEYTEGKVFVVPADFKLAITANYSQLQLIFGQGNAGYMNTIIYRSDETRNSVNINRFMDGSTEGAWKSSWATLWGLVFKSNQILDRIDAINFPNEEDKKNIKGEALALRGFAYLQFAWCWGGSPLITKEMTLPETYKVKRATQAETYAQAESDFKAAFDLLPETWNAANIGRVTKYAAAGMLGRLYMYTHNYPEAKNYLEKVIDKQNIYYALEAKYDDCFNDAKNNSKERVWEVQYLGGTAGKSLGTAQQFSSWFIPSALTIASDGPLMNNVTFTGPSGSVTVSESISGAGVYEAGDQRRSVTIVNGLKNGNTTPVLDKYYCKKFLKATANPPAAIDLWGNNLPILRYTDVKLMYAEALNEIDYTANFSTKILPIINDIRARAGGLLPLSSIELPDKEETFKYLVRERFVEFCFEGLRWPDLIRWGMAQSAMDKHFELRDEGFNITTNTPAYRMKSHNVLAPIPYSEIISYNNSAIMWQNDGY